MSALIYALFIFIWQN